jgi:hypothetical protein
MYFMTQEKVCRQIGVHFRIPKIIDGGAGIACEFPFRDGRLVPFGLGAKEPSCPTFLAGRYVKPVVVSHLDLDK